MNIYRRVWICRYEIIYKIKYKSISAIYVVYQDMLSCMTCIAQIQAETLISVWSSTLSNGEVFQFWYMWPHMVLWCSTQIKELIKIIFAFLFRRFCLLPSFSFRFLLSSFCDLSSHLSFSLSSLQIFLFIIIFIISAFFLPLCRSLFFHLVFGWLTFVPVHPPHALTLPTVFNRDKKSKS